MAGDERLLAVAEERLPTSAELNAVVRGAVLEIVIDRPERRNALTPAMVQCLRELLAEATRRPELRAVLITGAGEKAFCAGFDIGDISSPGSDTAGSERDMVNDLATAVTELPVPVVAAINGASVGAGCDLALACDIRVAVSSARFGMPPAKLGILYAWPGMERLLRTVGHTLASEMLLTGDLIDADRALLAGLVSKVVAADDLLDEARAMCDRLAANSPISVKASKESLRLLGRPAAETDGAVLDRLSAIQVEVWGSEDAQEGANAYHEGRKPRFSGRLGT